MTFSDRVKHAAFQAALDFEPALGVIVTPKMGAILPGELMQRETVLLHIGHMLTRPIPDLEVHEEGISATLAFGAEQFLVLLPWRAVLAFGPMAGAEVVTFITPLALAAAHEADVAMMPRTKPRMRAVPARNAPRPAPPRLRLVKADDVA